MRAFLLVCFLGTALATLTQVIREYDYDGHVMTGLQARKGQVAVTGLKARVEFLTDDNDATWIGISDVKTVAEKTYFINADGVISPPLQYNDYKTPILIAIAYLNRNDGEVVLEADPTDELWLVNFKQALANMLRMATVTKDAKAINGSSVENLGFRKHLNTYAGDCDVMYSRKKLPTTYAPSSLAEDIQSMGARKTSAGRGIQLEEKYLSLDATLDFSTCADRVAVMHYGAINQTNVTDTIFREVSSRTMHANYILKGNPQDFRVEQANIVSHHIMNPYLLESHKMIVTTNQTLQLKSASVRPRATTLSRPRAELKQYRTWKSMVQSPFGKLATSPIWVQFDANTDRVPTFPQMVTGTTHEPNTPQVIKDLKWAADKLKIQNSNYSASLSKYAGTQDGLIAEKMYNVHFNMRAMNSKELEDVKKEAEKDSVSKALFHDACAVAATKPTLEVLLTAMSDPNFDANKTASYFFTLGNNIQTPEILEKLIEFLRAHPEAQHPTLATTAPLAVGVAARRLCVSSEQNHVYYRPVYGDRSCDYARVVLPLLDLFKSKLQSPLEWVKVLNILAIGELGAPEGLSTLREIARDSASTSQMHVRFAALHAMKFVNFKGKDSQAKIFEAVLPIAESPVEDYRVRQTAFLTLLSWPTNTTFVQRMSELTHHEESVDIQNFLRSAINSFAGLQDAANRRKTVSAQNLSPLTRFTRPNVDTSKFTESSKYLGDDRLGHVKSIDWLSQLLKNLPTGFLSTMEAKLGNVNMPVFEGVDYQIHDPTNLPRRVSRRNPKSTKVDEAPEIYQFKKIFSNMVAFRPVPHMYSDCKFCPLWPISPLCALCFKKQKEGSKHQSTRYLSVADSSVILPTPTGLFFEMKTVSPTVFHYDMAAENHQDADHSDQTGIAKIIVKTNTYASVHNQMTKKTVMAAVDNEKSISLKLNWQKTRVRDFENFEYKVNLKSEVNSTAGAVPLITLRNVPFTAVAHSSGFPSVAVPEQFSDFTVASWIYREDQKVKKEIDFSTTDKLGLNAILKYEGEAAYPFKQSSMMDYLIRKPSQIFAVLISPTMQPYNMTLYQKDSKQDTEASPAIQTSLRSTSSQGDGKPIDEDHCEESQVNVDVSDTAIERKKKVDKFSDMVNTERSLVMEFIGASTKKIEFNLLTAYVDTKKNNKLSWRSMLTQFTHTEVDNPQAKSNHTSMIFCTRKARFEEDAKIKDLRNTLSEDLKLKFAVAGSNPSDSDSEPTKDFFDLKGSMSLTDVRKQSILKSFHDNDDMRTNTKEFFNLAKLDYLTLAGSANFTGEGSWRNGKPTNLLTREGNLTLLARDLLIGQAFPNIVSQHFINPAVALFTVQGSLNRSIGRSDVNGSFSFSDKKIFLEHCRVMPTLDSMVDFTPSQRLINTPVQNIEPACGQPKVYVVAYTTPYVVCRATQQTTRCKDSCNVVDTKPVTLPATCWIAKDAPEAVKAAIHQGYMTSAPNGDHESEILTHIPRLCVAKSFSTILY